MKRFFSKFNVFRNEHALYNPVDAVDRLTYVDTTQQIARMMQAGVNLKLRSNQGLTGEDFNAPSMPVYAPDIALSQKMINCYKEDLKANAVERSKAFEAQAKSSEEKSEPPVQTSSPV